MIVQIEHSYVRNLALIRQRKHFRTEEVNVGCMYKKNVANKQTERKKTNKQTNKQTERKKERNERKKEMEE